jgi:hypothetical protein
VADESILHIENKGPLNQAWRFVTRIIPALMLLLSLHQSHALAAGVENEIQNRPGTREIPDSLKHKVKFSATQNKNVLFSVTLGLDSLSNRRTALT